VTLVAVAVVLGEFWRLWIREFLDESGADALRLVEPFATLRTRVTGDLDFFVGISCRTPLSVDHIENSLPPPVEVEFASSMRGQFSK